METVSSFGNFFKMQRFACKKWNYVFGMISEKSSMLEQMKSDLHS